MYQELYLKIADALVDDGYVVVDQALNPKLVNTLLEQAQTQEGFKKAGISSASDVHIDNTRRRDKIRWLDAQSFAEGEFLSFCNGLREYLNKELYLGLSYYESHFAIYDKGDFYETHLDAFKNSKNRVVTTVYYLNEEWSERDGGELLVYDMEHNLITTILPRANTLVVFLSDKFPHEVRPAHKKRYSIAGWFRVDKV